MSLSKYTVFVCYSPPHNDAQLMSRRIEWEWTSPPVTWEDYNQVRVHVQQKYSATSVMIYACVPTHELKKFGTKEATYQSGAIRRSLKQAAQCKPWEENAEVDG